MKLRNQLLTLSLATLLVPWAGWKLVKELEAFLRSGQQEALLAAARTVAEALPPFATESLAARAGPNLHLRPLPAPPYLDGYADDWTDAERGLLYSDTNGKLSLFVLGGHFNGQLYLHCRVRDTTPVRQPSPGAGGPDADGLLLFLRSARGLASFRIQAAAPGQLNLSSQDSDGGQLNGYWLDLEDGYQVELALPYSANDLTLSIGAVDLADSGNGSLVLREAGTLRGRRPVEWLQLDRPNPEIEQWLSAVTPAAGRAWLLDGQGWVLAAPDRAPTPAGRVPTWVERLVYRVVAGDGLDSGGARAEEAVRFDDPLVRAALRGERASRWSQDPESATVYHGVAVPVQLDGRAAGAVVLETTTDGLLLVTNRALGRIMLTTLGLTLGLAAGLWWFATRLSRRVRRLSAAVSEAMDDGRPPAALPLAGDRDELGDLARNNARLLRAVSEYTAYLQKLAGRLSHELKTPLAITRSSLDNLATQALGDDAQRYLVRAREGLDRQAEIVRAMSEASRLEAAIEAAEWDEVDLRDVLRACCDAYRSLYPQRRIELDLPPGEVRKSCAPDLLAQALDKLVDNAVSLTGPDDVVSLHLDRVDDHQRICVRNSGSRLPDVLPEQLFDSLVTLRKEGSGRHLGLGLHIVRLVAEAHGGRATARNLPDGAGVEFCMVLGR